jgi:hypothetical protein
MANSNDTRENRWVDERLASLESPPFEPSHVIARTRLRDREMAASRSRRVWTTAVAIVVVMLMLAALPWPRAAAQRLWDRLSLRRVEVVQVSQQDLPTPVDPFQWKEDQDQPIPVRDAEEAERVAGFRPLLPPAGILKGAPQLSVVKKAALSSPPLKVPEIERALAAAGITDVRVPKEWEGTMLRIERGPEIRADYPDARIGLSQSPPFRLTMPAGFPVGRFVEIAYRLYGKGAIEAKDLSRNFVANPAWMLVFPHTTVRELEVRSGHAVAAGGQDGMCFFWNAPDRIFIMGASRMDPALGVAVANSVR